MTLEEIKKEYEIIKDRFEITDDLHITQKEIDMFQWLIFHVRALEASCKIYKETEQAHREKATQYVIQHDIDVNKIELLQDMLLTFEMAEMRELLRLVRMHYGDSPEYLSKVECFLRDNTAGQEILETLRFYASPLIWDSCIKPEGGEKARKAISETE